MDRFSKFLDNCLKLSVEHPVRLIMLTALEMKSSLTYKIFYHCMRHRNALIENVNSLIATRGPDINVFFDMCDVRDGLFECHTYGPQDVRFIIDYVCLVND